MRANAEPQPRPAGVRLQRPPTPRQIHIPHLKQIPRRARASSAVPVRAATELHRPLRAVQIGRPLRLDEIVGHLGPIGVQQTGPCVNRKLGKSMV